MGHALKVEVLDRVEEGHGERAGVRLGEVPLRCTRGHTPRSAWAHAWSWRVAGEWQVSGRGMGSEGAGRRGRAGNAGGVNGGPGGVLAAHLGDDGIEELAAGEQLEDEVEDLVGLVARVHLHPEWGDVRQESASIRMPAWGRGSVVKWRRGGVVAWRRWYHARAHCLGMLSSSLHIRVVAFGEDVHLGLEHGNLASARLLDNLRHTGGRVISCTHPR